MYVSLVGQTTQLFLRPMDQQEATSIAGTEGASGPFFSPDGEWVAFFARDKLLKISLLGGPPVTICDVPPGTAQGEAGAMTVRLYLTPLVFRARSRASDLEVDPIQLWYATVWRAAGKALYGHKCYRAAKPSYLQ